MSRHKKNFSVHSAGGEEEPEFQVAPMVDVLLVLLMFFTATTTTEVKSQIADLTLPEAQEAKDKEKGKGEFELLVNINRLGGLEADGKKGLDEQTLSKLIKDGFENVKKLNPNASYRVLVRADKDLGWEKTKVVLKAAAAAGVSNVVFGTSKGGTQAKGGKG